MIIKIINKEDLFNANVYYPNGAEYDWIDLKNKIAEYFKIIDTYQITVEDAAKYLIKNLKSRNPEGRTMIDLYNSFDLEEFRSEPIETCPSIGDKQNKLFLRGGNKRSIAYAMKIINNELNYETVLSSHVLYFTRLDNNNLAGLPTTKGKIKRKIKNH